jgi:uncharacterized protein (TIGR02588 family)
MAQKPVPKAAALDRPAVLEWTMSGLGLLLTLALLVIIGHEAASRPAPVDLSLRLTGARPVADGWIARVEVENRGDVTAAAVEIEGRLGSETASATLDYVPADGTEHVELDFAADPRRGLALRAVGWSEP